MSVLFAAVKGKVIEVDAAAKKLKLTLKQSIVEDGENLEDESDDSANQAAVEPDLDAEMLEAMDGDDSDAESDWRNAAGDEHSSGTFHSPESWIIQIYSS